MLRFYVEAITDNFGPDTIGGFERQAPAEEFAKSEATRVPYCGFRVVESAWAQSDNCGHWHKKFIREVLRIETPR